MRKLKSRYLVRRNKRIGAKYTQKWGIWLVGTRTSKIKADWCMAKGTPLLFPRKLDAQIMANAWARKDFVKRTTVKRVKVKIL